MCTKSVYNTYPSGRSPTISEKHRKSQRRRVPEWPRTLFPLPAWYYPPVLVQVQDIQLARNRTGKAFYRCRGGPHAGYSCCKSGSFVIAACDAVQLSLGFLWHLFWETFVDCIPIYFGQVEFSTGRAILMVTYLSLSFTKLFSSGSSSSLLKRFLYSNDFTSNCRDWPVNLWRWRCLIKSSTAETGDWGLDVDCHSSVAGGVKGNRICLSGGVPPADAGTVGVEAENLFSSFIARPVMSFVAVLNQIGPD